MKLISNFVAYIFVIVILSSCSFECKVGDAGPTVKKEDEANKPVLKDGAALYNGIKLDAVGVKVKKAFLIVNDSTNARIEQDNFVNMKTGVKLVLIIDEGWKESGGKVFLGASMVAKTETGTTVIEKPDMFESYDATGISPSDAKIISLSLYFDNWDAAKPVGIDVAFKVWDKKGDATITGNYTINPR
jgi:hypothetical protein